MTTALRRLGGSTARLPVRWRLALGVAVVAVAVFVLIGFAVYRRTESHLVRALDDSLREEAGEMVPIITSGRSVADLAPLVHDDGAGGVMLLQAFDDEGRLLGATPAARGLTLVHEDRGEVTGDPMFVSVGGGVGRVRLLAFDATIDGADYTLVSGLTFGPTADTLAGVRLRLAGWTLLGGVVTGALVYGLAAAALRPVDRMRRQAQEIRASSPGVRLPLPSAHDEVRRLGETLNHTLDDLEAAAEQRRLFVAHASHELRTPLTRLRTTLELARRPGRAPSELRAALDDLAIDTEELITLADGLLDLGSLETDRASSTVAPLDARAVVRDLVAARPGVTAPHGPPAWVALGEPELRRAVTNLLDNAELHGLPPVVVEVEVGGSRVGITVRDHGPGMPPGFGRLAFEPFTRAPASAGRSGTGLGLAIVAAIASRNGGEVAALAVGVGSPFGVRLELPRSAPPSTGAGQASRRYAVTGSGKPLTSTGSRATKASAPAISARRASTRTSPGSARATRRAARFTTEP